MPVDSVARPPQHFRQFVVSQTAECTEIKSSLKALLLDVIEFLLRAIKVFRRLRRQIENAHHGFAFARRRTFRQPIFVHLCSVHGSPIYGTVQFLDEPSRNLQNSGCPRMASALRVL